MISTLRAFDGRAVRRASIALFGTAVIAACDSDNAVSPVPTATPTVPTTASEYVTPGSPGNLAWRVVNAGQLRLMGGAKFTLTGPAAFTLTLTDNNIFDSDTTTGQVRVANLKPGAYTICEIAGPTDHTIAYPACHPGTVYSGLTTNVDDFVSQHLPYAESRYVDRFGAHVGGGVMLVKDSVGTPVKLVAEDGPEDSFKGDGKITVMLPSDGKFFLCFASVPAGYALSPYQAPCFTGFTPGNHINLMPDFVLYPALTAAFSVKDPFGNLVGPSSVELSNPRSKTSIKVTDNDASDLDKAVGKYLVKLPFPETFTLCQTKAPSDRYVDKNCKTVDLTGGGSVSAGVFTDSEKQVIRNP